MDCDQPTRSFSSGQSSSRDDPSRQQDWLSSRPKFRVAVEVVFSNMLLALKTMDLYTHRSMIKTARLSYGRTECCAVFEKQQCGFVQCCWHRNFYTTALYACILVVSFNETAHCLTLSTLVLFVFHRVYVLSIYDSSPVKTNAWYFLALSSVGLPRLLLLSNLFQSKPSVPTVG